MADVPFGFLNINKPSGVTSHDVVAKVRHIMRRDTGSKRVGHAGTLDPLANGVLVLCLGQATRLSEYVMHTTKRYRAVIRLGIETDTYDAEGEVIARQDASHITREEVETALQGFVGTIEQIPPVYSAIKKDGRKLYELARAGEHVEPDPRTVTIRELHISKWHSPQVTVDVVCSSGTYIRSLAHDLGTVLGVGASLAGLTRTGSGSFDLKRSINLDTLLVRGDWQDFVLPPQSVLIGTYSLKLDETQAEEIQHGRAIQMPQPTRETLAMAYLNDGHLLAVLEADGELWQPRKVFLPQN